MSIIYDWVLDEFRTADAAAAGLTPVIDSSATAASFSPEPGKLYVFTQPLTTLTVTSASATGGETEIIFTAGDGIAVTLPGNLGTIPPGGVAFTSGASYVVNIANGIAVMNEFTPGA